MRHSMHVLWAAALCVGLWQAAPAAPAAAQEAEASATMAPFTLASMTTTAERSAPNTLQIGTAGERGVYYPTGGAICRFIKRGRKDHGVDCTVESTGGSIYNLNALRRGKLDVGVVQSDWQSHAFTGERIFRDAGPNTELRSVFSLHTEPFTVLVRANSTIRTFDDLRGKRVNVGNPGSGIRATLDEVLRRKGWSYGTFAAITERKPNTMSDALCNGQTDAVLYAVGHPSGMVQEATSRCALRIIPFSEADIARLVTSTPFYARAMIPGGMYEGGLEDVATFGVKATLVTTAAVPEESIYQLTRAVFDNFEDFRTLHPVFATLDPGRMIHEGNTAPMHPGALRYFRERGLLPPEPESAEGMPQIDTD